MEAFTEKFKRYTHTWAIPPGGENSWMGVCVCVPFLNRLNVIFLMVATKTHTHTRGLLSVGGSAALRFILNGPAHTSAKYTCVFKTHTRIAELSLPIFRSWYYFGSIYYIARYRIYSFIKNKNKNTFNSTHSAHVRHLRKWGPFLWMDFAWMEFVTSVASEVCCIWVCVCLLLWNQWRRR